MPPSRYNQARTLVRRLCRLPGEDPSAFRQKVSRLRRHFERFNVDVSEICQWLMGLRRACGDAANPATFGMLGDFLLDPVLDGTPGDEADRDHWRLAVFEHVTGRRTVADLAGRPLPETLRAAMDRAAALDPTPTACRLLERLGRLEPAHRLVLLKAAAEWTVARFQRGAENWMRQHEEWQKEKDAWEAAHPELTPEVRDRFTNVFKGLKDPERGDAVGLRRKNPRLCDYPRLAEGKDNCVYAGEKGHGPLCWKYTRFLSQQKRKLNPKHFAGNAEKYLGFRAQGERTSRRNALRRLYRDVPQCKHWFEDAWKAYLNFMDLNEMTCIQSGRLPHCLKIGETWERSTCEWNPHTELCRSYRRELDAMPPAVRALEPQYREWRRAYLAEPRKPAFRYPSSRMLPMPKIFGAGFHKIDFDRSVLRLRLDDMPRGQWLEFGFTPWPRGYRPSKREVQVTSVHVHFVGTRARAGFRFDVAHRPSRFDCTQDELDELRSRRFPRRAQDQDFLDAARRRLLESFTEGTAGPLRLLAVDLGEKGACASVYEGNAHRADIPLSILKLGKLLSKDPKKGDVRGLRKKHVGRHLKRLAEDAARVAEVRGQDEGQATPPRDGDFRGLKRHVAWMIRDWVRLNAARVMAAAEEHQCDLIAFESLRGFRAPGYDRMEADKKRWLAMFAYGRVRRKVTEKAVERGMRVVTLPYFKSSQVCAACGRVQENRPRWEHNKRRGCFTCEGEACKHSLGSDANAARVLARAFLDEVRLPAPPELAS